MIRINIALWSIALLLCSHQALAQCQADGAIQIDQGSVPFAITASGKYQVVDNLSVASGTLIDIQNTAGDVYLCLSGFQLSSPDAIVMAANTGTLVVRDGTLLNAIAPVYATNMDNLIVESLQISGISSVGIYASGVRRITLRDNVLTSTGFTAYGIQIFGPTEGTIERNTIEGGGSGIEVRDGKSVHVLNNRIANSSIGGHAIRLRDSLGCLIAENTVTDILGANGYGIYMNYSSGCKIYNNVIRNAGADGIWLDIGSNENLILHNTVSGSGRHGIRIQGDYNQIQENVSNSNACYGITYDEGASGSPRYNVHRGNSARGNFGLSCGMGDLCMFICSEDFCWGEPLTNTSQGDNFMPCLGPAGCNACER